MVITRGVNDHEALLLLLLPPLHGGRTERVRHGDAPFPMGGPAEAAVTMDAIGVSKFSFFLVGRRVFEQTDTKWIFEEVLYFFPNNN